MTKHVTYTCDFCGESPTETRSWVEVGARTVFVDAFVLEKNSGKRLHADICRDCMGDILYRVKEKADGRWVKG